MANRERCADRICETGSLLYQRGFIAASEGNISCRIEYDKVLCTPTLVSKGLMTPEDLCVVDLLGRQVEGAQAPTSEIQVHLELYRANPRTRAVLHCHPPHATAFAISATRLPGGLLAEVEVFLKEIPTVAFFKPGTTELASQLAKYANSHRCAILKNHGAVAWDNDLSRCRWWIEMLDAYCRVLILAKTLGEMSPLPSTAVDHLRALGEEMRRDG